MKERNIDRHVLVSLGLARVPDRGANPNYVSKKNEIKKFAFKYNYTF